MYESRVYACKYDPVHCGVEWAFALIVTQMLLDGGWMAGWARELRRSRVAEEGVYGN